MQETKKSIKGKSKALIIEGNTWMESSESDEEVDYALMAKSSDSDSKVSLNSDNILYNFNFDNLPEVKLNLYNLHSFFKLQTLENERIKAENLELIKRNEHLEAELILMEEIKSECETAKQFYSELLKRE